jgi:hypothetical protein
MQVMHAFGHLGKRTPIQQIRDAWMGGVLRITFRPLNLKGERERQFARECAERFTLRTGQKNLLGSITDNFETIVPFVLAELDKRTPRM